MTLFNYIAIWLIAFNVSTAFSTQKDDQNLAKLAPHKTVSNRFLINVYDKEVPLIFNSKGTGFSELKSSLPTDKDDIIDKDYFVIETKCLLPIIGSDLPGPNAMNRLIHDIQLRPILNIDNKIEYLDSSDIVCIHSSPDSVSGSTNFSSGFSESLSVNIGFFGITGTGGVSKSYSWSSNESFTAPDTYFKNITTGEKARWRIMVYPYSDVAKSSFQPSFSAMWQAVNSGNNLRKKLKEKQGKDLSLSFELSYSILLNEKINGDRENLELFSNERIYQKQACDGLDTMFSFLSENRNVNKNNQNPCKILAEDGAVWGTHFAVPGSSDPNKHMVGFQGFQVCFKTDHFYSSEISIEKLKEHNEHNEHINIPLYIP